MCNLCNYVIIKYSVLYLLQITKYASLYSNQEPVKNMKYFFHKTGRKPNSSRFYINWPLI